MSSFDLPLIFEALSRVCADAAEVDVVYGTNVGTAVNPIVRPLADASPTGPTILLVPGAWRVLVGGGARFTFTARAAILVPRSTDPGGDAVILMRIFASLFDAFIARTKAYTASPVLQSVLPTEGDGLSEAEWPPESNAWYLTWPFELEVTANVNAVPLAQ